MMFAAFGRLGLPRHQSRLSSKGAEISPLRLDSRRRPVIQVVMFTIPADQPYAQPEILSNASGPLFETRVNVSLPHGLLKTTLTTHVVKRRGAFRSAIEMSFQLNHDDNQAIKFEPLSIVRAAEVGF